MDRSFSMIAWVPILPLLVAACGSGESTSTTTGSGGSTASATTTTGSGGSGGDGGAGGNAPPTFVEKTAEVALSLADKVLTITVKDGATPILTDVWLYTLEGGSLKPLTAFQDPDSPRKHRGLMMPCSLAGTPSQLVPCNDKGELNGVMTGIVREKLVDGLPQPDIDGMVAVTLDAAPTSTIVVVAAVEDQRYAGAAAIAADGKVAVVPEGVGAPETHRVVTYTKDIKPLLDLRCTNCHGATGINPGFPLDTFKNVVGFNFAFEEESEACKKQFPADPAGLDACRNAITAVEFMIELGAPALSPLLRRTRPDEEKSTSPAGIAWYGKAGSRFDAHGDRRMPPTNVTPNMEDDDATKSIFFDKSPDQYQLLWDWVSQGAPE